MNEDVMAGIQIGIDIIDAYIASGDCTEAEDQLLETIIEVLQNYGE